MVSNTAVALSAIPPTLRNAPEQTTSGGERWQVPLDPPKGASAETIKYIATAKTAIQDAVDLLGRKAPSPLPTPGVLPRPMFESSLGRGDAAEGYNQTLTSINARRTSLVSLDYQVAETADVVAAGKDQTLRDIQKDVAELNSVIRATETALQAAGTRQVRAALETALMSEVANCVQKVYARVSALYERNDQIAGNSGQTQPPGQQAGTDAGGSGGGGADMLSSLLPILAMIPMAAIPLLSLLPDLLKQPDDDDTKKDKDSTSREHPESAQPPPEDPSATHTGPSADPATTVPANPQTPADPNSPAQPNPSAVPSQ